MLKTPNNAFKSLGWVASFDPSLIPISKHYCMIVRADFKNIDDYMAIPATAKREAGEMAGRQEQSRFCP